MALRRTADEHHPEMQPTPNAAKGPTPAATTRRVRNYSS